ncbi:MAG TPA: DUF169 domain-containing protein [Candidatus Acidoferrum sp.]|nr:DUF169 domain-containing protein [Candidatus Acidoferrum sp.]
MPDYPSIARTLTEALKLRQPPIAVCLHVGDTIPGGVSATAPRVAAGCVFWEKAAGGGFATSAADHANCAIGTFTHNMDTTQPHEVDRRDALKVFADLGYVRAEDIPAIPVLAARPRHVVYAPLADAPVPPDVVLLFVRPDQMLILSEASQQLEGGFAPAMGRPACAVIPQVANTGRSALSLGCCGARAYLDALTDDVAVYALPGARIGDYAARIGELAKANEILTSFHALRRRDIEAGGRPTIQESLARLQAKS